MEPRAPRGCSPDSLPQHYLWIGPLALAQTSRSSLRLTSTQFSVAELTAIVEEAEACGTYVCAHAYTPKSIQRAVRCGVRR